MPVLEDAVRYVHVAKASLVNACPIAIAKISWICVLTRPVAMNARCCCAGKEKVHVQNWS